MHLFLLAFLATLALAFSASAVPIFPTQSGGVFTSTIVPATVPIDGQGIPLEVPTGSVAILLGVDGSQLVCAAASPGVPVQVTYTVPTPVSGNRQDAKAHAYAAGDCTGEASQSSANQAFFFFGPPGQPTLEL